MEEDYVRAVSRLLSLDLSAEQVRGVTTQLQRIEDIARPLLDEPLDPFTDEIAPVWRP